MNETLCRALLRAELSEEDIAARLGVDPKTVRRWMEGRALPYRRHRWALAVMLGVEEADLWPQLRPAQSWPDEIKAIYPHLDTVPLSTWLGLFGQAKREIGLMENVAALVAAEPRILATLAERAQAGVQVRLCIADSDDPGVTENDSALDGIGVPLVGIRPALAKLAPLRGSRAVEIRLVKDVRYNLIYYADDQLLVSQRILGIPARQAPVLHLRRSKGAAMFRAYRRSFEQTWLQARPQHD